MGAAIIAPSAYGRVKAWATLQWGIVRTPTDAIGASGVIT